MHLQAGLPFPIEVPGFRQNGFALHLPGRRRRGQWGKSL
jgi:hypothetical protein